MVPMGVNGWPGERNAGHLIDYLSSQWPLDNQTTSFAFVNAAAVRLHVVSRGVL